MAAVFAGQKMPALRQLYTEVMSTDSNLVRQKGRLGQSSTAWQSMFFSIHPQSKDPAGLLGPVLFLA